MRRALASLKYLPAALCGLLVVAWVVSAFYRVEIPIAVGAGDISLGIAESCLTIECWPQSQGTLVLESHNDARRLSPSTWLGRFQRERVYMTSTVKPDNLLVSIAAVPLPALATGLLPIAIAPFTRFRFPLWSYFAWTALVAAELAYYLR